MSAALGLPAAVVSAEGEMIAGITAETPAEDLDAYRDSFVRPDVPATFGRRCVTGGH